MNTITNLKSSENAIVASLGVPSDEQKKYRRWVIHQLRNGRSPAVIHTTLHQAAIANNGTQKPRRDQFRFATRLLERFPTQRSFDALVEALNAHDLASTRELMKSFLVAEKVREANRSDGVVVGKSVLDSLKAFANYLKKLFGMRFPPPIEFQHNDDAQSSGELVAHTDGSSLTLPAEIAIASPENVRGDIATAQMVNFYCYLYLVAHEQAHLALGSFDIDFASEKGGHLTLALGEERCERAKEALEDLDSILVTELPIHFWIEVIENPKERTGIADLFVHFENPSLASFIYNCLEDMRIEHWLKANLNGIFEIHRLFDALRHEEFGPPAQLNSAHANLMNGILQHATGIAGSVHIIERYSKPFEKICHIIDTQVQKDSDAYDSALSMIKIVDILEKEAPETVGSFQTTPARVSLWEIAIRRSQELDRADGSDLSANGEEIEPLEPNGIGDLYSEWTPKGLVQNAVRVIPKKFRYPANTESLTELDIPFHWRPTYRNTLQSEGRRKWSESGQEIDDELVPDYFASLRAGSPFNINYDNRCRKMPVEIHVLIDGSISMETPRKSLVGKSSFYRAKQIAKWMERQSRQLGLPFQAYIGVDGGRDGVHYDRIASGAIDHVMPVSFGGFRAGALIRHVLSQPRGYRVRRSVVVLTDGAPTYLLHTEENKPKIESLQEHGCFSCSIRNRCVNEVAVPIQTSDSRGEKSIWQPTEYQWNDVKNAIDTFPNDRVQIFLINDDQDESLWNEALGKHWVNGIDDASIGEAMMSLSHPMNHN
jgi:hypothetical protein